jgi:hypothetical protein
MVRVVRLAGLTLTLCAGAAGHAWAQGLPLVFTVAAPERTSSEIILRTSAVVEERGLALWSGTAMDFGTGAALSSPHWTIRAITALRTLPFAGQARPTFEQIEIVRPLFAAGSISVAGGGGIRQEWDGTTVIIGRALAGSDLGRGTLQGSVVIERVTSSRVRHDGADVVTSLGWSRPIGDRISVGVEGIGQDLEGLWDRAEADGGARLLTGPSLHVHSKAGHWAASLIAGPVLQRTPATVSPATPPRGGGHFGVFASASWMPSLRRESR